MQRKGSGFTLIELMIVIVIMGILVTLALPNLLSARLSSNETAAIGGLKAIAAAQAQFQKRGAADEDFDGWGEYGSLGEMAGKVIVRGTGKSLRPAVLNTSLAALNTNGEAVTRGYLFRLYLPDGAGAGIGEVGGGGAGAAVSPDQAEITWCCYAWPIQYAQSGRRTFFTNQTGEILATDVESYSGPGTGPVAGAAFGGGGVSTSITGAVAMGATGRDGEFWVAAK
ncbi:MAG: type IV pilin protein [Planctomycetota bacterium]|jgi:prepilin-type N-terminal cleavage/methylation domain-containing protein